MPGEVCGETLGGTTLSEVVVYPASHFVSGEEQKPRVLSEIREELATRVRAPPSTLSLLNASNTLFCSWTHSSASSTHILTCTCFLGALLCFLDTLFCLLDTLVCLLDTLWGGNHAQRACRDSRGGCVAGPCPCLDTLSADIWTRRLPRQTLFFLPSHTLFPS